MDDYPKKTYNVKVNKLDFGVDVNRVPTVSIDFQVNFNWNYFVALGEALYAISDPENSDSDQRKVTLFGKRPGDWFGGAYRYYFNDHKTTDMIHERYINHAPYLTAYFISKDNKIMKKSCLSYVQDIFPREVSTTTVFHAGEYKNYLTVRLGDQFGTDLDLSQLDRVVLNVELISKDSFHMFQNCNENEYVLKL
jgi:hypothetical protein